MTQHFFPTPEPAIKQPVPAWVFSILFHSGAIILLGVVVQPWPQGAAQESSRSPGIVLQTFSRNGDLSAGSDEQVTGAAYEPPIELPPPLLPSETPSDTSSNQPTQPTPPQRNVASGDIAQNVNPASSAGGGQRGSRGGTGTASVTVFGVQGNGNKFVYLFDRSSSMEGAPLAAAKRQLVESLQSLGNVHQFQIIFFNTRTQALNIQRGGRRTALANDQNKQLAANFVGGITADGGTDRLLALREALACAPDVIFFLTDADDPLSSTELNEIAQANGRAQAAICVIEFGRRPAPLPGNFLAELARRSGGQYGYVNTTLLTR